MKVRELLCDESKWCQGALAFDQQNKIVFWGTKTAIRWCLVGAIFRTYGLSNPMPFNAICTRLQDGDLEAWNDDKARTFAEVKALVDELDI